MPRKNRGLADKNLQATCPIDLRVNINTPGRVTVVNAKPACHATT